MENGISCNGLPVILIICCLQSSCLQRSCDAQIAGGFLIALFRKPIMEFLVTGPVWSIESDPKKSPNKNAEMRGRENFKLAGTQDH